MKLHNDSDLPAKYELIPQQVNEDTPIIFKSPQPKVRKLVTRNNIFSTSLSFLQVNYNFSHWSTKKKMFSIRNAKKTICIVRLKYKF